LWPGAAKTVLHFGPSRRLAALFPWHSIRRRQRAKSKLLNAKCVTHGDSRERTAAKCAAHSQDIVMRKRLPDSPGIHPLSPGKCGT
jgi:hypothetical protein